VDIRESLERILQGKDLFGARFYQVFFERCPEARGYFAGVDLKYQAALLTMALNVMERYRTQGYPAMAAYLKYLGHKHHRRNVPPELYPRWGEALLSALEQFHGADWDEEAARQWREAIERTTQVMLTGYHEPVHV
jgi:hemoglobin-like flavoprotein